MGFFDGVHLGHLRVIANSMDRQPSDQCCVLTFKVHPQSVLFPQQAPLLLTGLPHKLKTLAESGVQNVLTLPFDRNTMLTSAEDFLQNLHLAFPQLARVSVGPNWRFGHKRRGDIPMLLEWCRHHGIDALVTEPADHSGTIISSSRIREDVRAGLLANVSEMLGRPYGLYGMVVKGRQFGRTLGFPTLNLETEDQCLPPFGVYTGFVEMDTGSRMPAAINIGLRPTVTDEKTAVIEAHIMDFFTDLYGRFVKVIVCRFLRPEKKFVSTDDLRQQLEKDVAATRAWAGTI